MFCEIKGILVLDSDGARVYSKYYNATDQLATVSGQDLFEKQLKLKLAKFALKNKENDIVMLDSVTVIFKVINNVSVYVLGNIDENEILLASFLDCLVESLEMVYRSEIDRNRIIEDLDLLMLTIDEMIEEGNILAFDPVTVAERVTMREITEPSPIKPTGKESIFGRALQNAKNAISNSMSSRK